MVSKSRSFLSGLLIFMMILGLVLPIYPEVQAVEADAGKEITYPIEYQFSYTVKEKAKESKASYASANDKIGLNGALAKEGGGYASDYFIGWSENKNYIETGEGHLFFEHQPVSDLIKAGIQPGSKLYAMRANGLTLITGYKSDLNTIRINDQVSGTEFVSPGNPQKSFDQNKKVYEDKTVATYLPGEDFEIKRLDAIFSMNPFLQTAIYKDAWVGAFDNTSKWGETDKVDGQISVVDLHVSLDKRLELPDEFDIAFSSYTFYPIKIYSATDKDGKSLGPKDKYTYIGIDREEDGEGNGVWKRVEDNNPKTTFRTKSYILDDKGNKVRVYDYVIRTRMRNGHTTWQANKIRPANMDQIQSDMVLSLAGGTFTVKNEVAKAIAEGESTEGPIKISGYITAQQPTFEIEGKHQILITESEKEELDFKEGTPSPTPTPLPEKKVDIERIDGEDRNETSQKIAGRFFNKSKYVIVSRNDDYPDALTASLLARVLDCPILLNNPSHLEEGTRKEIARLGADQIILIGKTSALSDQVKKELDKLDADEAERIGGNDRYETSALIARRVNSLVSGGVNKAIIASGENFPDALASAPLAGKKTAPILLARKNSVPKTVLDMIDELKIQAVDIAGGKSALENSLEKALPKLTKRYAGANRYETATLIAKDVNVNPDQVYIASGEVFPDALTIGPVAAKAENPILLSRKSKLPGETKAFLAATQPSKIFLIGGVARLDKALEKEILGTVK